MSASAEDRETITLEFDAELLDEARELRLDLDAIVDAALSVAIEEHKTALEKETKKDDP
jgi:post-segregation antitoxin (ccd killing protein)